MSFTMMISKLIALFMIYLGYWFCYKWKIAKHEDSHDKVTRWSAGIMLIFGGIVILISNADIFNLPDP
jgi:uncharacterized membrane protein YfcA